MAGTTIGFLIYEMTLGMEATLKSKDITLLITVHLVKAMVFAVVMQGCELDHKRAD